MLQRFLDPATLASISGLDLVAKTVVDGFIAGLHRSPDYGFSQEFAEYRAYTPGDDLRHVDWNVFARSERVYLKRYRGETNTQLLILLDTSASMAYGSHSVNKLDYARFLAASLCYLAHAQRDAAGLIVFDEDVQNYVAPSGRQGQLFRLLHAIEKAQPGTRTDFAKPFVHVLSLPFAVFPDHAFHVVRRRCSLSLFHWLLLVVSSLAACVGPPPRLRASGWHRASRATRHGYKGK